MDRMWQQPQNNPKTTPNVNVNDNIKKNNKKKLVSIIEDATQRKI